MSLAPCIIKHELVPVDRHNLRADEIGAVGASWLRESLMYRMYSTSSGTLGTPYRVSTWMYVQYSTVGPALLSEGRRTMHSVIDPPNNPNAVPGTVIRLAAIRQLKTTDKFLATHSAPSYHSPLKPILLRDSLRIFI